MSTDNDIYEKIAILNTGRILHGGPNLRDELIEHLDLALMAAGLDHSNLVTGDIKHHHMITFELCRILEN